MKTTILSFLTLIISLFSAAQDGPGWSLRLDKKLLLKTSKEDPEKNIVTLSRAGLNRKGSLIITCKGKNDSHPGQWIRTIAIYTVNDEELLRKDSVAVKIRADKLGKLLSENKTLKVYSWALPKDPVQAARVRIRRVHLCTIQLI